MNVEIAERVAGVPVEAAYAWWTDYAETDHDGAAFKLMGWKRRRILERDEQGRVVRFRDEGTALGFLPITYESRLSYALARVVVERSEGPVGEFVSTYAFTPDGEDGTRIAWKIDGTASTPWAQALARTPGLARALARHDLHAHVRELASDLRR